MITRLNFPVSVATHPTVYQLAHAYLGFHSNYNEQYTVTTVSGPVANPQLFTELGISSGLDPNTNEGTVVIFYSIIAGSRKGILKNLPIDEQGWPGIAGPSIMIPLRNCNSLEWSTYELNPNGSTGVHKFKARGQYIPLMPATTLSQVTALETVPFTTAITFNPDTMWHQWANKGNQTAQFIEIKLGSVQRLITEHQ
jgi:hypothetical protein